jgi:hypothetical protein
MPHKQLLLRMHEKTQWESRNVYNRDRDNGLEIRCGFSMMNEYCFLFVDIYPIREALIDCHLSNFY